MPSQTIDQDIMEHIIYNILEDSLKTKEKSVRQNLKTIISAADRIAECIVSRHKIMIFGNGGSAADAQHVAAEFINRFRVERRPLPAIALTTDTSIITSIGNDYDFKEIFSKQVQALGESGDIAIGISTSGNSPNVIRALETASNMDLITMGVTGYGGKMRSMVDLALTVESENTARIQEVHITMFHILCELVDRILFPEKF